MLTGKWHSISVIVFAALAAGATAAIPLYPQYAAVLTTFAAALIAASGKTTQMARNAEPHVEPTEPKP